MEKNIKMCLFTHVHQGLKSSLHLLFEIKSYSSTPLKHFNLILVAMFSKVISTYIFHRHVEDLHML